MCECVHACVRVCASALLLKNRPLKCRSIAYYWRRETHTSSSLSAAISRELRSSGIF